MTRPGVDGVSWGWKVIAAAPVGMLAVVNDSPVVVTVSVKVAVAVGKCVVTVNPEVAVTNGCGVVMVVVFVRMPGVEVDVVLVGVCVFVVPVPLEIVVVNGRTEGVSSLSVNEAECVVDIASAEMSLVKVK